MLFLFRLQLLQFFLKILLVLRKTCFKVKVLKTLKIFRDCHIKLWKLVDPLNERFFKKFYVTYVLSVGIKMKPLRLSVFLCQDQNQLKVFQNQPSISCLFSDESPETCVSFDIQTIITQWNCKLLRKYNQRQPKPCSQKFLYLIAFVILPCRQFINLHNLANIVTFAFSLDIEH